MGDEPLVTLFMGLMEQLRAVRLVRLLHRGRVEIS